MEFFEIDGCNSKRGASRELFSVQDTSGQKHPYLTGLKEELDSKNGVYVFFDSRGQAIYAGKAQKQSLWTEMKQAFNRERGGLQKIKRVIHPVSKVEYKTSEEKERQIVEEVVPLSELASYFSAYEVDNEMIDDVEALLVRSFANNLLNKRMERFSRHRKKSK